MHGMQELDDLLASLNLTSSGSTSVASPRLSPRSLPSPRSVSSGTSNTLRGISQTKTVSTGYSTTLKRGAVPQRTGVASDSLSTSPTAIKNTFSQSLPSRSLSSQGSARRRRLR